MLEVPFGAGLVAGAVAVPPLEEPPNMGTGAPEGAGLDPLLAELGPWPCEPKGPNPSPPRSMNPPDIGPPPGPNLLYGPGPCCQFTDRCTAEMSKPLPPHTPKPIPIPAPTPKKAAVPATQVFFTKFGSDRLGAGVPNGWSLPAGADGGGTVGWPSGGLWVTSGCAGGWPTAWGADSEVPSTACMPGAVCSVISLISPVPYTSRRLSCDVFDYRADR